MTLPHNIFLLKKVIFPFCVISDHYKDDEKFLLYRLFWEYANYANISPNLHTVRDTNTKLMKDNIVPLLTPETLVHEKKIFHGQGEEDAYMYAIEHYHQIEWSLVKDHFQNPMHFLECLSLYFDWMPTEQEPSTENGLNPRYMPSTQECTQECQSDPTDTAKSKKEPSVSSKTSSTGKFSGPKYYPLRVKPNWFGHKEGAFYVMSQAQVFNTDAPQHHKSLYIITLEEDFPRSKNKKKPKNFDAYKDLCALLHGKEVDHTKDQYGHTQFGEKQKLIASYLLNTLDGTQEPLENPPFAMDIIRAMVMILAIPFVAEIAPPSDDAIRIIEQVYSDLKEKNIDSTIQKALEDRLIKLGGRNPGCHILCHKLLKSVKEGVKTFKMVFRHPDKIPAAFIPSRTGGVLEYRKSMFSPDHELLLEIAAEMNLVGDCSKGLKP